MNQPAPPEERYRSLDDLPDTIPVFPLTGILLLPRAQLPLNIFEPRYLAMVDYAMAQDRVIAMIQPAHGHSEKGVPPLEGIGTLGRINAYSESDDGRYFIGLTGVIRFNIVEELPADRPFRMCKVSYDGFDLDLVANAGEDGVDRKAVLDMFAAYLDARDLEADWENINSSTTEAVINALSMLSPYGPKEKQALLEAPDLATRAELLIALTEMELQRTGQNQSPKLQ